MILSGETFPSEGIVLDVVGGKADVEDWVAAATLDLETARSVLGHSGEADCVSICELHEPGEQAARVASRIDETGVKGMYKVAWRVPGKLAAGEKRRFLLTFGDSDRKDVKALSPPSEIARDSPRVQIGLEAVDVKLQSLAKSLEERGTVLSSASGDEWAGGHVAVALATAYTGIARERLAAGRFGESLSAIEAVEEVLSGNRREVELKRSGRIEAGVVGGHPYLGNDKAVYLWAEPAQGGGLLSIYDRVSGRELLAVERGKAPAWRIEVKRGKERRSYENAGVPCEVSFEAQEGVGRLSLTWDKGVCVAVQASLAQDEALLRSTIKVQSKVTDQGLVNVTFPVIEGILPMTENAEGDELLEPVRLGWIGPSTLVSERKVWEWYYPNSVQMTALLGEGRGLYFAEEDGQANHKFFGWVPDMARGTLAFSFRHPVLNWGASEPVKEYELPGDVVMGPFQGDWFDAARIYRKWALTAPWCAKGPIYEREDYPQWLVKAPYWTEGGIRGEFDIQRELDKHEFYGVPESVCADYWYAFEAYQHDRNQGLFLPRLGSEGYAQAVKALHEKGIRVVPYVIGWMWNMTTESYRVEDAEHKGAVVGESGGILWSYAGAEDPQAAMCPASALWRKKLADVSKEFVERYGVDGIYFDYFNLHVNDCFNKSHGHAIGGGNYWSKGLHELYEGVRKVCKSINPEAMLCGEDSAEFCIDVLDAFYDGGPFANAPIFLAIYHGYTQVFGEYGRQGSPKSIGRWWLMGCQTGSTGYAHAKPGSVVGAYLRKLIRCHWEFARPYLGYGEMLRPPRVEGDLPELTEKGPRGIYALKAVEGSAWLAPDGTVGIFFLNYDDAPHEFKWTTDLAEFAGIDSSKRLKVTRWSEEGGVEEVGEWRGGLVGKEMQLDGWGLIALKLEIVE